MTKLSQAQEIIGKWSGNYVVADYTDFCRLYVEIWQECTTIKKVYETDKIHFDLKRDMRIDELCLTTDPKTVTDSKPEGKPYSKTRAETMARIEFKEAEIKLLEKKLELEQIKVFFSTMDRFASAINTEIKVTFKEAELEPVRSNLPF